MTVVWPSDPPLKSYYEVLMTKQADIISLITDARTVRLREFGYYRKRGGASSSRRQLPSGHETIGNVRTWPDRGTV